MAEVNQRGAECLPTSCFAREDVVSSFVKPLPAQSSQFLQPMEPEGGAGGPSELGPLGSLSFAPSVASPRAQRSRCVIQQGSPPVGTTEHAQQINLNKACQIFVSV